MWRVFESTDFKEARDLVHAVHSGGRTGGRSTPEDRELHTWLIETRNGAIAHAEFSH
jgi:hypothetical protein